MGFWAGRRVLLTGHTGFKGAWLAMWLHELGAEVTGFAGPSPSDPSLFEMARVGDLLVDRRGDVRDAAAVHEAVQASQPEVVFHLAAQALVRYSYDQPLATWETNVTGTLHLLEAVRSVAAGAAVLVVTSDKCYANTGSGRSFSEGDALGGGDLYSASKAAQELVAATYREAYGLRIATVRAGNVIGGGDWARDRLVADFVRSAAAGVPLTVRRPEAIRPWQHVVGALGGYLMLAERLSEEEGVAGPWNFGPPDEDCVPVGEVVRRLLSVWPEAVEIDTAPGAPITSEAHTLRLDSTKARHGLGWRPGISLTEAIDATAGWHIAVRGGADPREVSIDQVRRLGREAFATSAVGDGDVSG